MCTDKRENRQSSTYPIECIHLVGAHGLQYTVVVGQYAAKVFFHESHVTKVVLQRADVGGWQRG